ncbi:MAG: ABC transporter ATP-binding protein [Caldilineaceae bacterium]|nr:ABC transporter ATP-binding protein [Caldilineaceae bacterium]
MANGHPPRTQTEAAPQPMLMQHGPGGRNVPGKVERAKDTRGTLRRLWGYLATHRTALTFVTALVAASTALNLLGPYLMGKAIDDYITTGDLAGLARLLLWMTAAYAAASLLTYVQTYIMAGVAQEAVRDIRADLFNHMQTLSLRFFDQRAHGELMSRLANDIDNVSNVLNESVTQLIASVLSMVGVTVVMLWLNPPLAAVTLITVPLMTLVVTRSIVKRTRAGFQDQQARLGTLNGLIEETVTGQRVVKAYVREAHVTAEFDAANENLRQAATRAQIYAGFMGPIMNAINNISLAIVVGAGSLMALGGLATVGTVAAFINYSRQFGRPLSQIANLYNTIQSAVAGAERVFQIIDETPELVDAPDSLPLDDITGDVVFEDVSFGYDEEVPVLRHVSLHAQPGQIVALVGPTGAGKTTIVNLLTRFYDIDSGRILIDGHDIRDLKLDDLRRQLGIVLQDTFLFAGTLMENIRYGRLDATDEEVIAAARLANADQFIHRLPQGYATVLSERGSNLSQGQRQLLAIARAILANPSILILDEATSSVDTRTEKQIQEAMLNLMAGRTSFVIAHRLSTIRDADQILVVDHGEVIERGRHAELLAQEGFYWRLYHSQFRATRLQQVPTPQTRA